MALSRQWYTRANIPMPDATSALLLAKSILWLVKACLKNEVSTGTLGAEGAPPGGAAWVCDGSSNGTVANMTGTDHWTSAFDGAQINRATAGSPHSWIVLSSPTGFRICIDNSATSDVNWNVTGSKNAYTGGTTSNRPTSTGEWAIAANVPFNSGTIANHNFQKVVDADGNFYFHCGQTGAARCNLAFWGSQAAEARGGDTGNFFTAYGYLNAARGPSMATMTTNCAGRNHNNTASHTAIGADISSGGSNWAGTIEANAVDGKFDSLPLYVISKIAGSAGVRGKFPDLAIVGVAPLGASEPTTGAQERTVFGDFLIPSSVVPVL